MRCAPRCSFVLVAAILVAGTGCYEPPVAWMRADVELDDVTLFHFAATQRTSHTGDVCALEAIDDARRFGPGPERAAIWCTYEETVWERGP